MEGTTLKGPNFIWIPSTGLSLGKTLDLAPILNIKLWEANPKDITVKQMSLGRKLTLALTYSCLHIISGLWGCVTFFQL